MLGKLACFFLGERDGDDRDEQSDTSNILYENVEDDWIIVDIQAQYPALKLEMDPLENLLIEHPSMSVYTLRNKNSDSGEEAELEEDLESLRIVPVVCHAPRSILSLIGNDSVLHRNHVHFMQRVRLHAESKTLSRNHLLRQNRAWKRHSGKEKTSRWFKQPRPRISRYSRQ
ncbi:tumor protein p53-inducible nuclear protein 1 isoform X1 [Pristis pectinata]|uniref:tumor protein p53-inducible nuclear protein 1 isoform X1 n=2 Tax=Pristis pectinata TaxID=685728 RepID=UPI00223E30D8|nr:tumor protein p53-inducible nuclear protein 1 isoform X1 [Pristis pectinata]